MSVEHLLLALLDNTAAVTVSERLQCDVEKLKQSLATFIAETTPLFPKTRTAEKPNRRSDFRRVLQRAVFHVQSSGKKEVTGATRSGRNVRGRRKPRRLFLEGSGR